MTPIPENPLEDPVDQAPDYAILDYTETVSYVELVASPVYSLDGITSIPVN